jgi:hypothetical protein
MDGTNHCPAFQFDVELVDIRVLMSTMWRCALPLEERV